MYLPVPKPMLPYTPRYKLRFPMSCVPLTAADGSEVHRDNHRLVIMPKNCEEMLKKIVSITKANPAALK